MLTAQSDWQPLEADPDRLHSLYWEASDPMRAKVGNAETLPPLYSASSFVILLQLAVFTKPLSEHLSTRLHLILCIDLSKEHIFYKWE